MDDITIARTIEIEQVWMAKDDAIVHFGYKNHKPMFQKLLKEFKENKKFQKGYRLPTYNMPIIDIKLFDEFLLWRELDKCKRKKT